MNYVRPNDIKLKYKRFTPSGCKDIVIRKFEFVSKTQFLCHMVVLPGLCPHYQTPGTPRNVYPKTSEI